MKNTKRTLTVGAVWSLIILGWWFPTFMKINWNFNPYSKQNWAYIKEEFQNGWVLNSASDWFWLLSMILILPIWIIGWRLCLRVEWKKMLKKAYQKVLYFFRAKTASGKKAKFKPKPSHKKVRPRPMNSTTKALKQSAKSNPLPQNVQPTQRASTYQDRHQFTPMSSVPTDMHKPAFLNDEEWNMPLDEIEMPKVARLEEDLLGTLQQAGYAVIKGPIIGKQQFDYIAIDSEKILICLVDQEKGDWLVDEEETFGEDAPLWFSETTHRSSPVFAMSKTVKQFSDKLSKQNLKHTVVPIFIEKAGNIINADEMTPVWKNLGMTVCRTDLGGPEELPSFAQSIPPAAAKVSAQQVQQIQNLL